MTLTLIRGEGLRVLRGLIDSASLHTQPLEPVCIEWLLEDFWVGYSRLPKGVYALTYWWRTELARASQDFVRVTMDRSLRADRQSALRRTTAAHELCHIALDHEGFYFGMYQAGFPIPPYLPRGSQIEEREAEYGAAYLLVPLSALTEMAGETDRRIAGALDVPMELVGRRVEIWQQAGE